MRQLETWLHGKFICLAEINKAIFSFANYKENQFYRYAKHKLKVLSE